MTESLPPELTVTRCFASADVRTAWLDHSTNLHLYILMLDRKTHSHPPTSGSLTERVKFFFLLKQNKDQSKRDQKGKKTKNRLGAATAADKACALAVSHCFLVDGTSDFSESLQEKKMWCQGCRKQSDFEKSFILRLHPLINKHTILNQSGMGRSKVFFILFYRSWCGVYCEHAVIYRRSVCSQHGALCII